MAFNGASILFSTVARPLIFITAFKESVVVTLNSTVDVGHTPGRYFQCVPVKNFPELVVGGEMFVNQH